MRSDAISNKDIVLFALYELGGARGAVHTEEIAHRVFEYPVGRQRYRWERYNYPDKERVARELRWPTNWKGVDSVKEHVNNIMVSDSDVAQLAQGYDRALRPLAKSGIRTDRPFR